MQTVELETETLSPSPFHPGEQAVQERLGVREEIEPWARQVVRPYLPEEHRRFYGDLPFVVLGARDTGGRPWATIVAGQPGFLSSPDARSLRIEGRPVAGDALDGALEPGADLGILGIEFAGRRRNRVNGRVRADEREAIVLGVDQSFGNCPQYIEERVWLEAPDESPAPLPRRHHRLTPELADRIRAANTFFIATGHRSGGESASFGMDVSHRGGPAGFVEIEPDGTLVFPDYAGNNHFNTIGNLTLDPRAGLLFVDFESGGLLQLTGRTEIDWDSEAVAKRPGARRLVRFFLEEAVVLDAALPIRWQAASEESRELRLIEKTRESEDVVSFVFAAEDANALADFEAGQYLPIELSPPDRKDPIVRTYSLSNGPGERYYRISVKREPQGVASRHLHDQLEVGDTVSTRAPAGDFVLEDGDRPIVLVSAGIGVTPMVSMLHALATQRDSRPVWFVHGARDGSRHAMAHEVTRLAAQKPGTEVHVSYSRPQPEDAAGVDFDATGRVDADRLEELLGDLDADFYLCGPVAFLSDVQAGLETKGVGPDRIHSESFGPVG